MTHRQAYPSITLVSKEQLAKALGVSKWSIEEYVRRGQLPRPIKFARNLHRWRLETIQAWLKRMERATPAPQPLRGGVRSHEYEKLLTEDDPELATVLEGRQKRGPARKRARLDD